MGEILEQLKRDGFIRETERGKFTAIPKASVEISGSIEMTRRGAGYVAHESFDKDIFIPSKFTKKALNGDEVRLEVNINNDNVEGKVVEIIERKTRHFCGHAGGWKTSGIF